MRVEDVWVCRRSQGGCTVLRGDAKPHFEYYYEEQGNTFRYGGNTSELEVCVYAEFYRYFPNQIGKFTDIPVNTKDSFYKGKMLTLNDRRFLI